MFYFNFDLVIVFHLSKKLYLIDRFSLLYFQSQNIIQILLMLFHKDKQAFFNDHLA